MIWIRGVQVFLLVTGIAVRWRIGIRRGMAYLAFQIDMRPGEREIRLAVVKRGRGPGVLGMTGHAVVGKIIAHVIRVCRCLVILPMAGITVRSDIGVTAGMALLAVQGFVRPLQREVRLAMVKGSRRPGILGMAGHAVVGKIIAHVVGVCRCFEILLMAGIAIRRGIGIAAGVALLAVQGFVRSLQRKVRLIMVEGGRGPAVLRVAGHAVVGKISGLMIGIFNGGKLLLMTAVTIPRQPGHLIIHMATDAFQLRVSALQGEPAALSVLESGPLPFGFVMAKLAFRGKGRSRVWRQGGGLVVVTMTAHTVLREPLEGVLGVAAPAVRRFMSAAQRKNIRMDKAGAIPGAGGHGMASLAIHTETRRCVVGIDGLFIIVGVASLAIQRCAFKLVHLFRLVAGFAIRDGVNPQERKALLRVLLENFLPVAPVSRRVTALAVDAESALMNILVAIRAGNSHPGKFQTLMTGNTVDGLMGAGQGKPGFGMIKLQRIIHILPTFGSVAFLTIPL